MKKTLLLLTAVGFFATGCIKIETNKSGTATGGSGTPLSETENKIVGKWRTTYSKLFNYDNGVIVNEQDALLAMDSCERDNLTDFRSDRTLYTDVNTLKCYPNQPQETLGGAWQVISNGQKIIFTDTTASGGVGAGMPLTITELTSNRMKLYRDSTIVVDGHTLSSKSFAVFEK